MAYNVVFRPAVAADLRSLYLYILEQAGHDRAGEYLGRIETACHSLETHPKRGTVRDHILPGLRIIGFERSASIPFRVEGDTVEILRILRRGLETPVDWAE